MNELLSSIIEIAPLYAKILRHDVAIGVSDKEKYLALFSTGVLRFPFPVGTKLKDVGYQFVIDEIMKTRQPITFYIPKEKTGKVTIKTIASPVFDKDEIVGCISVSIDKEKEQKDDNYSFILSQSVAALSKQYPVGPEKKEEEKIIKSVDGILLEIPKGMVHNAEQTKEKLEKDT